MNETLEGMTLRDYFAAKVMQAILTNRRLEDCDDDVVADRFTYNLFTKSITSIPVQTSTSSTPIGNTPNVIT